MPIYQQIVAQVKYHVATGTLKPNEEMPSVRALAAEHVINPNTVARAYLELEREGVIYKRRGTGTFVGEAALKMSKAESTRLVGEAMDKALVLAAQVGITREQLEAVFTKRLREFDSASKEREK